MTSFSQVSIANCSIELSKENLMRLGRVLLPPDAEVLSSYCKQVKLTIKSYRKQVNAIISVSSVIMGKTPSGFRRHVAVPTEAVHDLVHTLSSGCLHL